MIFLYLFTDNSLIIYYNHIATTSPLYIMPYYIVTVTQFVNARQHTNDMSFTAYQEICQHPAIDLASYRMVKAIVNLLNKECEINEVYIEEQDVYLTGAGESLYTEEVYNGSIATAARYFTEVRANLPVDGKFSENKVANFDVEKVWETYWAAEDGDEFLEILIKKYNYTEHIYCAYGWSIKESKICTSKTDEIPNNDDDNKNNEDQEDELQDYPEYPEPTDSQLRNPRGNELDSEEDEN